MSDAIQHLREECARTLPAMDDAYRKGGPFLLCVAARIIRDLLAAYRASPPSDREDLVRRLRDEAQRHIGRHTADDKYITVQLMLLAAADALSQPTMPIRVVDLSHTIHFADGMDDDEPEKASALPEGYVSIGDYIAELEKDPEHKARLDEARVEIRAKLAALPEVTTSKMEWVSSTATTAKAHLAAIPPYDDGYLAYIRALLITAWNCGAKSAALPEVTTNDQQNALRSNVPKDIARSVYSDKEDAELLAIWNGLSGGAKDNLKALIYHGPLWDGDVPSKAGRDELLDKRLASKAIVKREQGFQVANYKGWMVYRVSHPSEFESPHTLATRAISKARK